MNVDADDRLGWALVTQGDQEIVLVSAAGQAIRFGEDEVRSMGLAAGGVGGMRLGKRDRIVFAGVVEPQSELITVTSHGFAKRSSLAEYPTQGRNGGGVVTHKTVGRTGPVAAALLVDGAAFAYVAALAVKGAPRVLALDEIPPMGRGVQGKQVIDVGADNAVKTLRAVAGAPAGPSTSDEEDDAEKPRSAAVKTKPTAAAKPATVIPAVKAEAPVETKAKVTATPARKVATAEAVPASPSLNGQSSVKSPAAPAKAKTREGGRVAPAREDAQPAPIKANGEPPMRAAKAKAPAAPRVSPAKADRQSAAARSNSQPPAPTAKTKASAARVAPAKAKVAAPSAATAKAGGEKPAKVKPAPVAPLEQATLLTEARAAVPAGRPANPRSQKLAAVTSVKAPKKK
jgi:DNA gyrase subunit A